MKKEQEKGADDVRSKYREKRGVAVLKSFFGTNLVGLMMTPPDYTLVTNNKQVRWKTVEAELENDIDFLMVVNVTKLTMVDGYSSKEKGNPKLGFIMHLRILGDALLKFAKEKPTKQRWDPGIGGENKEGVRGRPSV